MLLQTVEYARPASVEDALRLLSAHDGARPLAGGQTLINVMKARIASPEVLIDLNAIDELRGIRTGPDGALELGAMATYTDILLSSDVARTRPILAEVAQAIADVQVRNRGTIGGNLCSNDPTNHFPPVIVAIGAELVLTGQSGDRTVPAEEFFVGVYMTAAGPGDLVTSIRVPAANGASDGFAAVTIGADGTCIVNAAATVTGASARIAVGCVGAVPALVTAQADETSAREAVRGAGLQPPADVHASAEYRRHLAGIVAGRAVRQALERAGG